VARGQGSRVLLSLVAGVDHELIPGPVGATLAPRHIVRDKEVRLTCEDKRLWPTFLPALLRLHDEAVALVEIYSSKGRAAVRLLELHAALERIVVQASIFLSWLGSRNLQQVTQLCREKLEIGPLRAAGCGPARDEVFNGSYVSRSPHEGQHTFVRWENNWSVQSITDAPRLPRTLLTDGRYGNPADRIGQYV